ncbi:NUDIX hydrolase [Streptomyces fulvoviolaceus]|uniref:NUDIX hydrolase n=1 Tax=Streptomyces fulvoviolaceus TaxID=285535 RepID=UPI0021C1F277|nr:NUDIX hydrolase [Streptomyces fulvoviolaceus]MCT9078805.1 NUDIX hydrolase [Streptomyces fulvoviolaceus]
MGKTSRVAMAVIVDGGRLLLIRRSASEGDLVWAMPGGKVEDGESPEQAAVRETLEETGLTVKAEQLLGERTHPDTGRRIVYVACTVLEGSARRASLREVSAVAWAARDEVPLYVPRGLYPPVQAYLDSHP